MSRELSESESKENDNQNFIIHDNNAYTEDNILIYNLFVYSIPKQVTEEDVNRYFSKFGNVLSVNLVTDKKRSRRASPKVGFVNFSEPESACSALRKDIHRLQGKRIGVKPGDSWNQPNADKMCGPTKNEDDIASTSKSSSKDASTTNGGMHILWLNDDCLETIFGYLNLKEKIYLARVCQRFQDICQMHCLRQLKHFGLSNISGMTLWEIRDIFRLAGENMVSITGSVPYKNRERIIEFIRTFCGKLKSIRLVDCKVRNECLKKLLRGCPELEELTLRNCALKDNSIQTMTHLNRLETLELPENYELTGKSISRLVQLNVLNIYGCSNIQTSHLVDICKTLPNLRALDIRRCDRLSATFFEVIAEHCKELEIFKMSCPEFPYERVALLPRLKQLELLYYSSYGRSQKRILAELVAHKADQLEVLKIVAKSRLSAEHMTLISKLRQLKLLYLPNNPSVNDDTLAEFCKLQQLEELIISGSSNITNHALLNLVKSCQRLHRLNIQFCKEITIEFLLETIRFLKASENRQKPLVLITYGTALDSSPANMYEDYNQAEKQSLIRVLTHSSSINKGFEEGVDFYGLWDGELMYDEVDDGDDPTENYDEDLYFSERDDDDLEFDYEILGREFPNYHDADNDADDDDDGDDIYEVI